VTGAAWRVVAPHTATAFATSLLATGAVLWVARRRKFLDIPNERSSHSAPTPRSGGLGIVTGLAVALATHGSAAGSLVTTLAMLVVACATGVRDDFRPLRPAPKLALVLVAGALSLIVAQVDAARALPLVGDVPLGILGWPVTLLWLAGYANGFNFMDGIDGMAALTAGVSGLAFAAAGARHGDVPLAAMGSAIAGAALGFLPWNFPKARIFMGDAGSLPLGMMLAFCAVWASGSGALSFPASVLLLGPFLFDVTFTLVRRARAGKRLGQAHREHLYQRLTPPGSAHAPVSLLYAAFAVVTGTLGIAYDHLGDTGRLLCLAAPLGAMMAFGHSVLRLESRRRGDG
jgi:UDP-N-acetylmuramyl pentapeptide phosphotransferase/UDP-N-acetylglucosamine-1-phosphate transferase